MTATAVADHVAELTLKEMRLSTSDVDSSRVKRKAAVAIKLITDHIDAPVPWVDDPEQWPATVIDAAVTVTRELYQRKDAPFGIVGAWSDDGVTARISGDPLAGVEAMLTADKQQWGIA